MFRVAADVCEVLSGEGREALRHGENAKRAQTLPLWLGLAAVCCDFLIVWLSFRFNPSTSLLGTAVWGFVQYAVRLVMVLAVIAWRSRRYRVSAATLGIVPSAMKADFCWSLKVCIPVAAMIVGALALGLLATRFLEFRLPAPPPLFVLAVTGTTTREFILLAGLGAAVVTLIGPVTEELIYRALLLPILTARTGLVMAIAITSVVFGSLHALAFGQVGIALPQLAGGVVLAAAFSARWSVLPSMIIHGLGNFCICACATAYVELHQMFPDWFAAQ